MYYNSVTDLCVKQAFHSFELTIEIGLNMKLTLGNGAALYKLCKLCRVGVRVRSGVVEVGYSHVHGMATYDNVPESFNLVKRMNKDLLKGTN